MARYIIIDEIRGTILARIDSVISAKQALKIMKKNIKTGMDTRQSPVLYRSMK